MMAAVRRAWSVGVMAAAMAGPVADGALASEPPPIPVSHPADRLTAAAGQTPAPAPAEPQEPVYNVGNGVQSPVLLKKFDPAYTSAATAATIEGEVWLDAIVETNGKIEHMTVAKSLDAERGLDQSAMDAARKWEFKPGTKDGKPVRVRVQLILEFRLRAKAFGAGAHAADEPGIVPPKVKVRVQPTYTAAAMRAKIEGTVDLQVVVAADGHVADAQITKSLDTTFGLDGAALETARKWVFDPGTLDDHAVPVVVGITIEFRLR